MDRPRDAGVAADAGGASRTEWRFSPESSHSMTSGTLRRVRDDDVGRVRVARFLESGGVDLVGRVVDVDTGGPLSGVPVEARLEKRFVEIESVADGTFRMPGMVPGSKVVVWIGDRRERVVAERVDLRIPSNGNNAELGVVGLLAGNELDPRLDGWIGIYVASKDGRIRVSAINAWVPAVAAGIAVGDAVLSVNGRDIHRMGPRAVAFLLRGPTGRTVNLELESSDGTRRQVTVQRLLR
jgi:hypothetical protein